MKIKSSEIHVSRISRAARRTTPAPVAAEIVHFRFRRAAFLLIVTPLLLIAAVAGIVAGSTHVDWTVALHVIGSRLLPFWIDRSSVEKADDVIIWLIRTPRVLVAALVGGGLAV